MNASINLTGSYRPNCPKCLSELESLIASVLRTSLVQGIHLAASAACGHSAPVTAEAASRRTTAAPEAHGTMNLLPGVESALNGFDDVIK